MWMRQFPRGEPVWGQCRFVFDVDAEQYDWLVVYDDLPTAETERFSVARQPLACPAGHTLLVTTEPASVKYYGRRYTRQFAHILSSQEPWVIDHPGLIHQQAGLRWFYGCGERHRLDFDRMRDHPPLHKTNDVSTVCSAKRQRHTLHHHRYRFTQRLKRLLPELDIYGHGVRLIDDKAEALDSYRYHVAIENHIAPHHWTEKLADAFLGCTLPFYHGCPNASDYFPAESFIAIDLRNPAECAAAIREAIETDAWSKRLPAILEARRRVLERYNLFAELSRLIEQHHPAAGGRQGTVNGAAAPVLLSRHAVRRTAPAGAVTDWLRKMWVRTRLYASR